ncbi:MAG: cyclic nucleotide-binding domain-containing protein [Gammaproteobacteria bacterium]|nr:cyclic nucleotide-binding domain-containing protein [Gammaproteobacteria bacterium]MDH3412346.1 cyclic nucleotide-binding domain-containing protein [Gammaproteobacteria bacterium]
MGIQNETELLRNVPTFAKLDPSRLKLLAFTSQCLNFDDGEILFRQGDRADSAYVIMSGEVDIVADTGGTQFVAGTLGRNQMFGELGVLTKTPRSATLRAKGELVALRISDDIFLKLLAENSEVALDVMRQLSEKLILSHHQVEELKGEVQKLEAKRTQAPDK